MNARTEPSWPESSPGVKQAMNTIEVCHGPRRWAFAGDPKASLLDQLLAQAVPIGYSCRRGDCSQCTARLVAGSVSALDVSRPLWHGDQLLTCNAAAVAPLAIEIAHHPELEGIRAIRSPAKVQKIEKLTADVVELTLRLPPGNEMHFLPGQYMRLTLAGGVTRSYSLAAGPASDRMLRMHIRCVESGVFSQWLLERAAAGSLLHVEGPQGSFFLRSGRDVPLSVFLATGTGIAPIWAILSSIGDEERRRLGRVCVYWGNQRRSDAYLSRQLVDLSAQRDYEFRAIFSRDDGAAGAVSKLHVQDCMLAEHPSLHSAQVFACGNPAMIEDARRASLKYGLREGFFHGDPFTTS